MSVWEHKTLEACSVISCDLDQDKIENIFRDYPNFNNQNQFALCECDNLAWLYLQPTFIQAFIEAQNE